MANQQSTLSGTQTKPQKTKAAKKSPHRGINLYQRKEPAFSREQKQLIVPKVLYIPIAPEANEISASAFLDKVIFLGTFDFDYPGVSYTRFGRYKMGAATRMSMDEKPLADYDAMKHIDLHGISMEKLVSIAKRAYIIDETDGIPLFEKLQSFEQNGISLIVADAVDEEPYVSSNINTLLQKGKQIEKAIKHISEALNDAKYIALCYSDIDDAKTVIPSNINGIDVKKITGKYPVRPRVHQRILSLDMGEKYGLVGTQALLHLYRAIYFGKKQNTTIITVAGDCINYSCNVEVTIGTTIEELLNFCGLKKHMSRLIIQGSMRGLAITNPMLPVLHSTKAVIALSKKYKDKTLPCINCGKCTQVCPVQIAPNYILKYHRAGNKTGWKELHPEKCIGCGCCSYICPTRIELREIILDLKKEVHGERG